MLRIGPNGKLPMAAPPASPQAGPPPPPELPDALAQGGGDTPDTDDAGGGPPQRGMKYSIDKVSQDIARYTGPDCRCNNCQFFNPDNTCHVVDGQVDPNGICALHTCDHDDASAKENPDGDPEATDVEPAGPPSEGDPNA